jgi:kynurenine formamidase
MELLNILNNYRVIDLSHVLEEEMPRPQVPYGHIPWKSYERGDYFNTNMFLVFEHAGTHVDAPIHLGGVKGPSIDQIPPEQWMGPCNVIDVSHKKNKEEVTAEEIIEWEKKFGEILHKSIVLFHFNWEKHWTLEHGIENQPYLKNNPGLSEKAALLLAKRGVKLVGGDIPTIDSYSNPSEPAHRVFLGLLL